MSDITELIKISKQQQEKYNYYLIALCVAAIAFSVNITLDEKLSYYMIPLGIAVSCWLMSIIYGLNYISQSILFNSSNIRLLQAKDGHNPIAGSHPEKIKIVMKNFNDQMDEIAKKIARFSKSQKYFFYIGMCSFIIWRIIVMSL